MSSFAGLGEFALTCVLIEITPGPNMAWIAVISASEGRRAGFLAVLGIALGLLIVGLVAAFGLATAISASPILWQALRWGGILWLFYLAYDAWVDAAAHIAITDGRTWFLRGLVTNVLNPKAALFYVAMLPGFVQPDQSVLSQTMMLTAIYVAIATLVHSSLVVAAGTAAVLLTDPKINLVIRRVLAALLAGVAMWFAWQTR